MKISSIVVMSLAFGLAAAPAGAETLYKLIDKNGKVTYVDTPPKDFDGKVVPVEIDPNKNRATLIAPGTARGAIESIHQPAPDNSERVKQAQAKLEAARKALADARDNPGENDVQRRGNAGGGTRPVFTDEYEKKLAVLEDSVRQAEAELKSAQAGR